MIASSFPVFWKDVRSMMKPLVAFLVLQVIWLPFFFGMFWYWEGGLLPFPAFGELMVLSALGLGQIFGLVAAGYVRAEEETAGTDVFLSRLATSRSRITAEKLAAGVAIVGLLWIIQAGYHVVALPFGGLWTGDPTEIGIVSEIWSWLSSPVEIAALLLAYYFGSYLIGVLVSLVTNQTVLIVVIGYAVETILYGFIMMGMNDTWFLTWDMAWLNLVLYAPLVLVPLFVARPGSRFRIPGAGSLLSPGRAPAMGLVWKSFTENSALQTLSFAFLAGALLVPIEVDVEFVATIGLLLIVALGTASYAPVEKRGLDCLLYQHPVPRHHVFWAKISAAVLPVLAVAVGTLVYWSRGAPVEIVTVLAYAGFAYTCAVLMTLTFERAIIALLAAVSLVIASLLLPIVSLEFVGGVGNVEITGVGVEVFVRPENQPGAEAAMVSLGLVWPALFLAVSCLALARWMATSAAVLTGSASYRLKVCGRLYAAIAVVSFVVTVLSWRGPLSVIG
jgi:ABC-type transport system involved in multi-copper enzyme maturation permease subunit